MNTETQALSVVPNRFPYIISEKDAARFRSKVSVVDGGCHVWIAGRRNTGYGQFYMSNKSINAHRIAWSLAHPGEQIPSGMCVLHSCHNRVCVNPEHLRVGTHQDNMDDKVRAGRQAVGERHGSKTRPERVARGDRHGSRTHPDRVPSGDRHGSKTHPECLPRGEAHYAAKLTAKEVLEIRRLYATGEFAQRELGVRFGISRRVIGEITHRDIWKHI